MSSTEETENEHVKYSNELCEEIAKALLAMPTPDAYNKVMPIVVAGDPRLYMVFDAIKMDKLAEKCRAEANISKPMHHR